MRIPEVKRLSAFFDSVHMSKNPVSVFHKYQLQHGPNYKFHFGGIKPAIVTTSPDVIQHILQKNYTNYHKSEIQLKRLGHFLGDGLLTSHGKYWLTQRRIMQEGFKKDKLKSFSSVMNGIVESYCAKLNHSINDQPVEISSFLKNMTFEMVMGTLYSNSIDQQELSYIGNTISNTQEFIIRQIVQPYMHGWFRLGGELKKHEMAREASDEIIMRIVKNRRNGDGKATDMLQTLLDVKYKETGTGMTDKQVLMESMQLIVAGHETSSTALTWILYLLAEHPESFNKVRDELIAQSAKGLPDIEDLSGYEYTIKVIEESLRLYPPFWMIDRQALEDDAAGDVKIPKGTTLLVFIYGLHHSKAYWDEPEIFNPERFDKINMQKHLPFTHIPFGGGPRGCIGGKYALLQMLIILAHLFSNYDMSLSYPGKIDIGPLVILRPRGKVFFNFKLKK
jgi:cytochrome P450